PKRVEAPRRVVVSPADRHWRRHRCRGVARHRFEAEESHMKRTVTFILALAALTSACNRGASTTSGGGKPTVALVLKTLNHPFFVDMRRGAQEAADRLGVNLQVQAAEREIDVEKQMQIVENMIQTGVQALCITPSGSREIVSALVKARDA